MATDSMFVDVEDIVVKGEYAQEARGLWEMAGQMVTPTHLCILVTVEYFKSRLWKTIGKCGVLSLLMILIFSAWTYWRYYL